MSINADNKGPNKKILHTGMFASDTTIVLPEDLEEGDFPLMSYNKIDEIDDEEVAAEEEEEEKKKLEEEQKKLNEEEEETQRRTKLEDEMRRRKMVEEEEEEEEEVKGCTIGLLVVVDERFLFDVEHKKCGNCQAARLHTPRGRIRRRKRYVKTGDGRVGVHGSRREFETKGEGRK